MQMTTLILSGLALLAACASIALSIYETKRSKERNIALLHYVDTLAVKQESRIKDLENGVIPDYDAQKKAVASCNDFYRGINNILGFDPVEQLKKSRKKDHTGGDTE